MPNFYGQYVGVGEETAWGTPVARTTFARCYPGTGVEPEIERKGHQALGRRAQYRMLDVAEKGTGRILIDNFYPHTGGSFLGSIIGKLFKHTLGVYAVSGAGPYVHTFTVKDGGPPWTAGAVASAQGLTVEANYALPDSSLETRRMDGGMVSEMKAAFGVGEGSLKLDWSLIGKQVSQVVKTVAPTFPDYDTYLANPSQCTVSIDGTDASAAIESVEINVATGLQAVQRLGSRYTQQPVPQGKLAVTGTIRRDWLTTAPSAKGMFDKFLSGATAALIVTLTNAADYTQVWTLSKIVYTGSPIDMAEGGVLPVEFPFEAVDDSTNTIVKIVERSATLTTY